MIVLCPDTVCCRRYRRQMTLQSMLWQVRLDEIDFVTALLTGSIRVGNVHTLFLSTYQPKYTQQLSFDNLHLIY